MQKEDIKFQNSTILEGMTSLRALFAGRKAGTNDRPVERLLYDEKKQDKLYKELSYLRAMSKEYGFPLLPTGEEEINTLAIGNSHGGLLAECGSRTLPMLSEAGNVKKTGFYAMIQGIEDPYNFGYAIRSLYACGVDGIILPERNWLSAAGVVARSSAGASEMLPVYVSEPLEAADFFHERGYTVVCADERTDHLLHKTPLKKPILLIVGGERRGISRALLDKADLLVKIGYGREFRASLSAASATTMLAYEIFRQNCE
ncbi:MAG: RNA methyltransferase [Clostridia bacterium]|nr:RNA methyltransferase [Clostridia bacterium]